MTTGAYQDAIKAFMNADTVEKTSESHYQKARCFVALGEIQKAQEMLEECIQLMSGEMDMLLNIDQ